MQQLWNKVQYKNKVIMSRFGEGIDTFFSEFDNPSHAVESQNLSTRKYPGFSVRAGRSHYAELLSVPNAIGQRANEYLHVVDNTVWKYWNGAAYVTVKDSLSSLKGNFGEFSTDVERFTIYSNGVDRYAWNGTIVSELNNAPTSKIFISHKGRLFWAKDASIVFSALNLINDYSSGGPAGSGLINITQAKGDITSLAIFNNVKIAFTEYGMHALYGIDPETFELTDIEGSIGNISHKSTTTTDKRLYWVWYDGVYEYDGSVPIKVSEPHGDNGVTGGVTKYMKNINFDYKEKIVSAALGDVLYISIPYGNVTENNLLLVFDTNLRKWNIHNGNFIDFISIKDKLYGLDASGRIWNMVDGTVDEGSPIYWYYITKLFNDDVVSQKKVVSNLWMVIDLPAGSSFGIYFSQISRIDEFELLKIFSTNSEIQNTKIFIPITRLQNVDWYRFKFVGSGQCTVHFMEKNIRVKVR